MKKDSTLKKMLKASEIGGTRRAKKRKAKKGNITDGGVKANKTRFSTDKVDGHADSR
jgi:hypothetical protein